MNSTERFKVIMDILNKYELGSSCTNHEMFEKLKEEELTDTVKIEEVIKQIELYEQRRDSNPNRYPEDIMQFLRQRHGLNKYDTSKDEMLNEFEPKEAFEEVCNWNGFYNWAWQFKSWIKDIYGIELDKSEEI